MVRTLSCQSRDAQGTCEPLTCHTGSDSELTCWLAISYRVTLCRGLRGEEGQGLRYFTALVACQGQARQARVC